MYAADRSGPACVYSQVVRKVAKNVTCILLLYYVVYSSETKGFPHDLVVHVLEMNATTKRHQVEVPCEARPSRYQLLVP